MAKKTDAQLKAEEALRFLQQEAELREKMNRSYDDYIETVKKAHTMQKSLNKSKALEAEIEKKISDHAAGRLAMTPEELASENAKLEVLKKQNRLIEQQVELYKSASKEVNILALTTGKAFKGSVNVANSLVGSFKRGFGDIKSLGIFEFDKAIKQSALNMGVLSKEGVGFRNNLKDAAKQTSMMGVNLKGLAELQASYSENLGRTVVLSKEGLKGLAEMSKVTGLGADGSAQMAADMELQGYSAERTADYVEQTLNSSHKMGVNATKVMKNLSGNLKLLNKYHFKEGAKGLAKMAELVTKLGVDMNSVSGMADKLWNIEGAVEMSAQLNVMGGAWAQMADPFHMMYMARNDMKGLTEEIARASQESIHFNDQTKEFDMTAEGMHKLKIIAEQTGIAYEDLVTMGKNMAKFDKIKSEVGFSVSGSDDDKAMLEYISSKSNINKDGKSTIMIDGKKKLLSQLSNSDKTLIKAQMEQQQTMEERAKDARTFDEQITYLIDQLKVYMLPFIETLNKNLMPKLDSLANKFTTEEWGKKIETFAETVGKLVSGIGEFIIENPKLTAAVIGITKAAPLISGVFKLFGGVWDTVKWFKNGVSLASGFNSAASVGGGYGSGDGSGDNNGFSLKRTGKAIRGGFKQGGIKGALKAGGKSLFRQGKGAMKMLGGLGKGGLKMAGGLGKGLMKGLGKGLLKSIPLVGSLMSLGEMGVDMFQNGFSWKKLGKGLTNAAVDMIPGVGLVNSVAGGMGYGAGDLIFGDDSEDALFNAPVKDGIFSSKNAIATAINPALGAGMMLKDILSTRGVIQNGKITPIDTKDDVLALKKGGAIDKHMVDKGPGTSTMKHVFNQLTINGTIKVEIEGNHSNIDLSKDESFRRKITRMVQEETIKQLNQGKPKG